MTDDTLWQQLDMLNKIVELLSGIEYRQDPDHHLAPPFVTAYQLAIMFALQHPEDFDIFCSRGFPMGGRDSGSRNSLPQYLARQLSQRIGSGEISHLVLQPHIDDGVAQSSLVMGPSGPGLMPSSPARPANGKFCALPMLSEQPAQQPSDLGNGQRDQPGSQCRPLLASSALAYIRHTARKA